MKIQFTLLLSLLLLTSITLQEEPLTSKSNQLYWTGKAAFNSYSLTGTIDIKRVSSKVTTNSIEELIIEIDMTSLNHENQDLKGHLRSKDFFEVDAYNSSSFILSKPAVITNGQATLTGTLTIKNKKQEESFVVLIKDNQLHLDIAVNRLDYGITFNSPTIFEKMKDQAIADEFQLKGIIDLN